MSVRYFALVFGIVYVLVGIAGFVPGLLAPPEGPPLEVEGMHGRLLGLFPVNVLHSLVHLLVGVWGVVAWRAVGSARLFARIFAVVFAVLAIMGLVPVLDTTFGLIPLHGHDVWLHALSALVCAFFGFRGEAAATGSVR